jgi:hypothetical protein
MTYGTEPHFLYKRGDAETSAEAAYAVDTTKLEQMVHDAIINYGEAGCISDMLLDQFERYPYSSITARYAALERKGFIYRNGDKAKGRSGRNQLIMRAIKHKKG